MPYDDLAALITSLRYQYGRARSQSLLEAASYGSERKFHREEAIMASSRCTDIIHTLNANMLTGIDPDDWQNRGAQIEVLLGQAHGVAA